MYQNLEPCAFLQTMLKLSQNQNAIYSLSLPDYNQSYVECCHWHNYLNVDLKQKGKYH